MEMENIEPYKSLRTVIFEVQAAVAPKPAVAMPTKKPQAKPTPTDQSKAPSAHKPGDAWETASGWAAMNKAGVKEYGFADEKAAKAWVAGTGPGTGKNGEGMDTSRPVQLDKSGAVQKKPTGVPQTNAKITAAAAGAKPAAPQPAGGAAAPQAKTAASDTQRTAQPQGSQKGAEQKPAQAAQPEDEHPEVAREDPKTEFDSEFKEDPKATAAAKTKRDMRKSNIVAAAIKAKKFTGPRDNKESVFGDPRKERAFIEELNHAALSAMRGDKAYDFELCSQAFADVGFCFDPKTKSGVSKGIPRDRMPQFSSQVDPSRTDTPAFKALMAAKGYTSPDQVTPEDLKSEVNMEKQYREALEAAGYTIEEQEVPVTSLKPIQGQLKGEKVAGMYGTLLAAQEDETYAKQAARLLEPIYVSDGYVIDGHHRWAAQCAVDIANGGGANTTMKTRTITKNGKPVPVDEIIDFSNKFQKDIGLLSQTRGGETIPEKKPQAKTQKEWNMSKFGAKRMQNLVESLNRSAAKKLSEAPSYEQQASFSRRMGHEPVSLAQQVTRDARSEVAVRANQKTAQDLVDTMDKKPEGTTFEIYGKKDGKEVSVKVKKIRRMNQIMYVIRDTPVEIRVSGVGLQVVNKKTNRVLLDRGADMIWESADFTDVGMISINEMRKLSPEELKLVRPGVKKTATVKKPQPKK